MNENCFAMHGNGKCGALTQRRCPGCNRCAFYKTRRQLEKEKQAANEKIRKLPAERQKYIAEKYFGGQMPWKGDCV